MDCSRTIAKGRLSTFYSIEHPDTMNIFHQKSVQIFFYPVLCAYPWNINDENLDSVTLYERSDAHWWYLVFYCLWLSQFREFKWSVFWLASAVKRVNSKSNLRPHYRAEILFSYGPGISHDAIKHNIICQASKKWAKWLIKVMRYGICPWNISHCKTVRPPERRKPVVFSSG